jgi:hypothetical protein
MNVFSIIAFIVSISSFFLGIYVLKLEFKNSLNRLFFFLCISLSFWSLFACIDFSLAEKEEVVILYKIGMFCLSMYYSFSLHFNFNLTQKKRLKLWQIILIYIPVPYIMITTIFSTSLFSDFVHYQSQWLFIPAFQKVNFYFITVYIFINFIISIYLIYNYGKKIF